MDFAHEVLSIGNFGESAFLPAQGIRQRKASSNNTWNGAETCVSAFLIRLMQRSLDPLSGNRLNGSAGFNELYFRANSMPAGVPFPAFLEPLSVVCFTAALRAADEKIPLSVVRVNRKPQYMGFYFWKLYLVPQYGPNGCGKLEIVRRGKEPLTAL